MMDEEGDGGGRRRREGSREETCPREVEAALWFQQ